jgi:hypothetical protein
LEGSIFAAAAVAELLVESLSSSGIKMNSIKSTTAIVELSVITAVAWIYHHLQGQLKTYFTVHEECTTWLAAVLQCEKNFLQLKCVFNSSSCINCSEHKCIIEVQLIKQLLL